MDAAVWPCYIPPVARFRSNKRFKELQRKAKKEAKEERKKERQEGAPKGPDDDIDWSQAVGMDPPPGTVPESSDDDPDSDLDDEDDDESDSGDGDEDGESRE